MLKKFNNIAHLNGQNTPCNDLTKLAFSGFAHFTALQVRAGKIKGLDLHLTRLNKASIALFGTALPDKVLIKQLQNIINISPADCSVVITIFSESGEFSPPSMNTLPSTMISITAPENGPTGPLALKAIEYERPLADIKHVGEIGKTYYLHKAIKAGFDDAVFIDKAGYISEGSIWNLAFWDGHSIVWPSANMLQGTMMSILQRQLNLLNIPQRYEKVHINQLAHLRGAVVMNSWTPAIQVSGIEGFNFDHSQDLKTLLHQTYKHEPALKVQ